VNFFLRQLFFVRPQLNFIFETVGLFLGVLVCSVRARTFLVSGRLK